MTGYTNSCSFLFTFPGVRVITLPTEYTTKMKQLLKDEFARFIKSYENEKSYGLRMNPLKFSADEFSQTNPFTLTKIPWVENGFFYRPEERPGKHPYHDAGLYYIQEPSAMAVVELMNPQPGEKILDLAAAPGGKTTQIAAKMENKGFLVTNEIHHKRAQILSRNVERMGIKNAVVTNESPERLAQVFPEYFDRILVDAPCSGEGMFRKNPDARNEWSVGHVLSSMKRQLSILEEANKMLKEGGQLVYSTCTFSPEENEQVINQWVKENPHYEIEDVNIHEGFSRGRADWVTEPVAGIDQTVRLWPHLINGEGHFIAVLRKTTGIGRQPLRTMRRVKDNQTLHHFHTFVRETLHGSFIDQEQIAMFGNKIYVVPHQMPELKALKILRPGWHLGTNKKNRFEPSHALALGLKKEQVKNAWPLTKESAEIFAYLKGETFPASGKKGWHLITVDGYTIGWGKLSNQMMKNHYPKGLRWLHS